MDERVIYEHDTENKIKEWGAKFKELKTGAKMLEAKAKKSFYERIEKLLEKKQKIDQQFSKMKSAGTEAWIDMKIGIDKAFQEMDQGFKKAVSRLKEIKEKAEA